MGFLGFLLQAELVLERLLFLLELALDGLLEGLRQTDVADEYVVELDVVGGEFLSEPILDFNLDFCSIVLP